MKLTFQAEVNKRSSEPRTTSHNIDCKYTEFVNHIRQASEVSFQQDVSNKKQKEWLTDEIMNVVDKKAKAFLDWQNSRGTSLELKHRNSYRLLRNLAKKKIEARQRVYWDEFSLKIENAIKQHDPATAHTMIRRLRGDRAKINNLPSIDMQGNLLTNSQDRLNRWKEYFNDLRCQ